MSRKRVVTGSDEHGRPVAEWDDTAADAPPYGFMEPAFTGTIERRQATPDELAAARARETPERVIPPVTRDNNPPASHHTATPEPAAEKAEKRPRLQWWTPDDIGDLKASTGAVTGEDLVRAINEAGEPPEEGDPMSTEDAEQTQVSDEEAPSGPLWALSEAARDADAAWLSLRLAELTWDVSRAALAAAMAECATIMEPNPGSDLSPTAGVTEPDVPERTDSQPATSRDEAVPVPATLAVVPEPKALRQPGHHPSHAGQGRERDDRAQRVTEAVARHGGDRSAAAVELGMRPNALAMVLKHADRRAGATA